MICSAGNPVKLDEAPVQASVAGRSVLITGAAGTIGSELCRQVARYGPACMVAFDQAESELFRIENELREKYPELELVVALGDIRDSSRLDELIRRHGVESIYHAAAYKHVPMMESHVLEAVRNNILGTWNLVRTAHQQQSTQSLDDFIRQSCQSYLRDGRDETRVRTDSLRSEAGPAGN